MAKPKKRIGFVSTRLAGTDGVSLETRKWVNVLNGFDYESYFFAGESDWSEERSYIVAEAHFDHPEIRALNADLFDNYTRRPETSARVQKISTYLKSHLYKFIHEYGIDLLIVENALSIPMNIPLGLALTELIAETDLATIAHHHDFAWERSRFKVTAASDYQLGAFPPILHSVQHVVINSYASRQLALRTGVSSILIPNVMDFDAPPPESDIYLNDLRAELGIAPEEILLLQPTRIVPRKRIELAIELSRRLDMECSLVISHSAGDEGVEYVDYLREYASLMGVRVLFAAEHFSHDRGLDAEGRKIYSLADGYLEADLVTYPSTVEGFGNAFLETIYYRKPIVMSTYEIYRTDIRPKGFKVIGFGDFITDDTIRRAREILLTPGLRSEIVEHNYELGRRFYSYMVLEHRLRALMNQAMGIV